jgi:hypothetical protein
MQKDYDLACQRSSLVGEMAVIVDRLKNGSEVPPGYDPHKEFVKRNAMIQALNKQIRQLFLNEPTPFAEITVNRVAPPGGKIFLYAVTATGNQSIEELYVGVPTFIEVQFDSPNSAKEITVDLAVSGQKLTLKTKRYDQGGYLFRSEAFVPTVRREDPGETFNPTLPPKGGGK